MASQDAHAKELIERLNLILGKYGPLVKEPDQQEDIAGFDAFVDKEIRYRFQIKERAPNPKNPEAGKDLLIELIKVWPPPNLISRPDPDSLLNGRDTKLASDKAPHYILLVDKDENVYVFDTAPAMKMAFSMYREFMALHYASKREFMKRACGDVRVWTDPSIEGDYKGVGYRKCGAFIRPSSLEIKFQGKLLPL